VGKLAADITMKRLLARLLVSASVGVALLLVALTLFKRHLVRFLASVLIGIAGLVVLLAVFVVWASVDQTIVERRAQAFCDAFAVGETTSRDKVNELLAGKTYRELWISEDSISVIFPTHLHQYYSCLVWIDDWKVISKNFQFKD
jgi:membrane protein required for beta-lactamase induction